MSDTQHTRKQNPHLFPVGTIFELNDDIRQHHTDDRELGPFRCVTGIVQIGVRSFVLKTGIMREQALIQGERSIVYLLDAEMERRM